MSAENDRLRFKLRKRAQDNLRGQFNMNHHHAPGTVRPITAADEGHTPRASLALVDEDPDDQTPDAVTEMERALGWATQNVPEEKP